MIATAMLWSKRAAHFSQGSKARPPISRLRKPGSTPGADSIFLLRLKYRWPLLHISGQTFLGVLALKKNLLVLTLDG